MEAMAAGRATVTRATALTLGSAVRCFAYADLRVDAARWLETHLSLVWVRALGEASTPIGRLRRLATAQLVLVGALPDFAHLAFGGDAGPGQDELRRVVRTLFDRFFLLVSGTVADGQLKGDFPGRIDAGRAADLILATLHGTILRWSLSGCRFDLVAEGSRLVDTAIENLRTGIAGQRRGRAR
jgi:BetI-type transcriptional repressor, C-terminal